MGLRKLIFRNKKGEQTFVPSCTEHVRLFLEQTTADDPYLAQRAYDYMKENDLFESGFLLELAPTITYQQENQLKALIKIYGE